MSNLAFTIEKPISATQPAASVANVVPFSPTGPPIPETQPCCRGLYGGRIERGEDIASSNSGQQRYEPSVGMES